MQHWTWRLCISYTVVVTAVSDFVPGANARSVCVLVAVTTWLG
jgi:hypothetical protein